MKLLIYSSKRYERTILEQAFADSDHEIRFEDAQLNIHTARLAQGYTAVCLFVNDDASAAVLNCLADYGVNVILLRCAGYNNVDLDYARQRGLRVFRVPAYSPHAVAEHAVALLLSLNRHIPKSYQRVRDGNFSLEGLVGFDLYQKTVGVVGTGYIGTIFAEILLGFGCRVIACDTHESSHLIARGVEYRSFDLLLREADIISLHCPLTPETHHMIGASSLSLCKTGVHIVNTSRGGLIDARACIGALKTGQIGGLALDVYEEEADLFFADQSEHIISDDTLMRLTTFPNVIITGHQAFLTREALINIAATTRNNADALLSPMRHPNEL